MNQEENNKRKQLTESEKETVGKKCANCESLNGLEYHHIIPLALGGTNNLTNFVCLCSKCHGLIHGAVYPVSRSELIKAGQKASSKKSGRPFGKLDKMTPELENCIKKYVDNNPTLERFNDTSEILKKYNISINTFKKYCRLEKEKRDAENLVFCII